jgi:TIR domain
MAELAHDASGPPSSKPTGTAHQASGPASSDKGKLRVFISYSRDDLKFADQLDAGLDLCGFECFIDRHGISGGEDWKRRLGNQLARPTRSFSCSRRTLRALKSAIGRWRRRHDSTSASFPLSADH